ncbi:PTS system, mannitol-specific IIBC component [Williamsoniiplasma somnilux]|uniref:PTS system mannitol-specific EIICB component n=1 Tax=Williamsoniiplasma somnilux TaxID=215578 RepID=A0A2K8NZP9_9MOLU|nr:PTS mannitol transporter subunit IICB [Williamsoniiplasma somnilux]ATZ18688.1 PTS system, mannitol-specific IIBC component [Williamsoniiplasma somnilux]
MKEIQKELNKNLSHKQQMKLFFLNNFNGKVMMRRSQKFGGWLSAMIMPIIGVIIGWGLLTAFFIPTGWTPVAQINDYVVGPMIAYLIPILIGFHAGKIVHGNRGGIMAAFVVFGVIAGNKYNPGWWDGAAASPQFLGAMIVGPIAAGVLKGFDKLIEGKIRQGFEMLVNNFSMGIIGAALALGAFYGMPWVINGISYLFMLIVGGLVNNNIIFLAAIIVEPAKILFLNNAINHGIFTTLGIPEAAEAGKSILFLLEANPGTGLGMMLAIMIFDKKLRGQAGGASIIQFFGGIHEVYFPFALMRPAFIIALIGGGLVGDAVFQIAGAGLVAPASPGSIIAIFAVAGANGAGNYAAIAGGIAASCVTSLIITSLIFIINRKKYAKQNQESLNVAKLQTVKLKGKESKVIKTDTVKNEINEMPKLIIFACEAGMGSSAMGAGLLRKKIKAAGLDIEVKNYPIKELPTNAEFVITQETLTNLAKQKVPNAIHRSISNFLDNEFYENIIVELKKKVK